MTAVVTGAAGFLGSRLVRRLVDSGRRVRAVDLARAPWPRLDGVRADRLVTVVADITDRRAIFAALEDATEVFHVAALYELGTPDPARMRQINVEGTENVLDAAIARAACVVHVSSVAALGPTGPALVGEEHWNPDAPRSHYAATKREAHLVARAKMREGRVRIAMPATIWGAGDPSMLGRAEAFLARSPLTPIARPDMHLCFVHVEDCAEGIVRVADRGADSEEYVLSAEVVPIGAWIASVARPRAIALPIPDALLDAAGALAGKLPHVARRALPWPGPFRLLDEAAAMSARAHWAFSGEKARERLGWNPVSSVNECGRRGPAASRPHPP
jgi:nucleoside-diphosphate-sugar epimerase